MAKQPSDHLRSQKKPVRFTTWIASDSDLAAEIMDLEQDLQRQRRMSVVRSAEALSEEALSALEAELEEKREQLRDSAIKFTFQNLKRSNYEKLLSDHPPSATQVEAAKADGLDLGFNPDTFPMALIVASCVEPEMDKEELVEWLDSDAWNMAEVQELFSTALKANNSRRVVDMGKGSKRTVS